MNEVIEEMGEEKPIGKNIFKNFDVDPVNTEPEKKKSSISKVKMHVWIFTEWKVSN